MQFSAKTVEEAVKEGLTELGITEEEASIKVIEEPTKGLFGKMKGKAVVEIEKKLCGAERAVEFLQELLNKMDVNAKAELQSDEDSTVINVIAQTSAEIIGYRGEVLDALQTLAGAVANIGNKVYKKVTVDCENYRGKREETLISLAHKLEAKATDMRREVILEPMNPFERRIIHTALAESATVTTKSDGKEPNRYVVIIPNDKEEGSRPYNAARNSGRSFGHGNGSFGGGSGYRGDRRGGDRNGDRYHNNNRGFGNRNRSESRGSGFSDVKKKAPSGFGTYLGNSLKNQ